MDKFKLKVDRAKPSQEEILATKDFDQLFDTYQQQQTGGGNSGGMLKHWPYVLGVVVAIAAGWFLWPQTEQAQPEIITEVGETEPIQSAPYAVLPPDPVTDLGYQTIEVEVSTGGQVDLRQGMQLRIEPNAFETTDGAQVGGTIQVRYRQPKSAEQAAAWGLKTDALAATSTLELTWMQDGKTIQLREGMTVTVEMLDLPEEQSATGMLLDEETGWEATANAVETETRKRPNTSGYSDEQLAMKAPVKPRKLDEEALTFTLETSTSSFPELRQYEGLEFELDLQRTTANITNADLNHYWDTLVLTRIGESGDYRLEMIDRPSRTLELIVYPVIKEEALGKAMEAYDAANKTYIAVQQYRSENPADMRVTSLSIDQAGWYYLGPEAELVQKQ